MTIQLGFGLITAQRYPGDRRSDAELYADALSLAHDAESLGFDSVWVSEHHFVDDAYMPSLLPVCAALAARTQRITIGTALLLAPLYEPIRLAEDAATVDLLSGGRFVLGLGLGWREEEFEAIGVPLSERAARLEDAVATCRQAWAGEAVTGGSLARYPSPRVTPAPARPGGPPIWVGGISAPAVRRAGRIADGFMATEVTAVSPAEQVAQARAARAGAGRDREPFAISVHLPTFVHEGDPARAWERIRPFHRYVSWKYDDMEEARGRSGPPPAPPDPSPKEEEELRRSIVFGTPEEVSKEIEAFASAAGGDLHYIARLYWPGMPPAEQRALMELFARRVAPLLSRRRPQEVDAIGD